LAVSWLGRLDIKFAVEFFLNYQIAGPSSPANESIATTARYLCRLVGWGLSRHIPTAIMRVAFAFVGESKCGVMYHLLQVAFVGG
jgi:hypothetical protein